jgi:hypothetical protein
MLFTHTWRVASSAIEASILARSSSMVWLCSALGCVSRHAGCMQRLDGRRLKRSAERRKRRRKKTRMHRVFNGGGGYTQQLTWGKRTHIAKSLSRATLEPRNMVGFGSGRLQRSEQQKLPTGTQPFAFCVFVNQNKICEAFCVFPKFSLMQPCPPSQTRMDIVFR